MIVLNDFIVIGVVVIDNNSIVECYVRELSVVMKFDFFLFVFSFIFVFLKFGF